MSKRTPSGVHVRAATGRAPYRRNGGEQDGPDLRTALSCLRASTEQHLAGQRGAALDQALLGGKLIIQVLTRNGRADELRRMFDAPE